jgi:hypothetical protein
MPRERHDDTLVGEFDAQMRLLIEDTRRCLARIHTTLDQLDKLLAERGRAAASEQRPRARILYGGGQSSLARRNPLDRAVADRVERPQRARPAAERLRDDEDEHVPDQPRPSTTDLLLAAEIAQGRPTRHELAEQLRTRLGRSVADALIESLR